MDNDESKNSIHDKVLEQIETSGLKMKPKWHFVVRTAFLIVGTILVALTLLYLASFILFTLRETGLLFLPGFGVSGIGALFFAIPWLLVLLAIVFIILLQILVTKYSFGYGRPLLYSALGIIILVFVGGFLVERTELHHGLFMQAENHRLPFGGDFYREFGEQRPGNVTIGIIKEIADNKYKIFGREDELFTVAIGPQTQLPSGSSLAVGDTVVIFGDRHGTIITAIGIRKLPPVK